MKNKLKNFLKLTFFFLLTIIIFKGFDKFYFKKINKFEIFDYEQEKDEKELKELFFENFWWLYQGENRYVESNKLEYDFDKQFNKKIAVVGNSEEKFVKIKVLKENKIIKGFILFFEYEPKIMHIRYLCVSKDSRRKGYAKELVKYVIDYSFKNEYKALWLNTRKENTRAINLYKNLGFEEFFPEEENNDNTDTVYFVIRN